MTGMWRTLLLLVGAFALPAMAADVPAAPAAPGTTAPSHVPLRQNADGEPPSPAEPEVFKGYGQAPAFVVVPQKEQLTFYPCSQCHKAIPTNPTPRKLEAPHPAALSHGKGRMWCLDCHQSDDRDSLRSLRGQKVDFNDAHLVCGQCHSNRHKDWYFGAHGKRAVNWKGERAIFNCTHCHDPHDPSVKPRKPSKPPPVRAGLEPMRRAEHEPETVWERHAERKNGGTP